MALLRLPDVVQTLAADAAGQVCVQLSRGRLVVRRVGRALAGLEEEAGAAHFDFGQTTGKTFIDRRCSSGHVGHWAGIGGAVDVSRSANRKR